MSISDLVPGTPVDTDYIGEGAAKIRAINDALVEAFPAVAGEISNPSAVGSNPPTHVDYSNLFTRLEAAEAAIANIEGSALPAGVIIVWSGAIAAIPTGWVLCNGLNGTPDLTDKFVVGAGDLYAVGESGGSAQTSPAGSGASVTLAIDDHSITESNLPRHDHHILASGESLQPDAGANAVGPNDYGAVQATIYNSNAEYAISRQVGGGNNESNVGLTSGYGSASVAPLEHTGTVTIGDHVHDSLPPYYALAYIMKTA